MAAMVVCLHAQQAQSFAAERLDRGFGCPVYLPKVLDVLPSEGLPVASGLEFSAYDWRRAKLTKVDVLNAPVDYRAGKISSTELALPAPWRVPNVGENVHLIVGEDVEEVGD
jgi:hypothetical protein